MILSLKRVIRFRTSVGRDATKDENGDFVWKLRDEIRQALEETDLSHVRLYSEAEKAEQVDIDSLHSNNAYNKWLYMMISLMSHRCQRHRSYVG